jgi:hypothetical protein
METDLHCPIIEDCSVYLNNICHNEIVGVTYRSLYCLQVNRKYKTCRRYDAYLKLGKQIPRHIMPNSHISMDELTDIFGSH